MGFLSAPGERREGEGCVWSGWSEFLGGGKALVFAGAGMRFVVGDWTDGGSRERTATNLQLISDLCDLTVPGSALEYVNLDDGIVGLAGTVSSLIGLWSQWKKTA